MEKENQEKQSFDDILKRLTVDQKRFIVQRQEVSTDKDAALSIGVKPNTVSQWKREGYPIDEAVEMMANDGVILAINIRRSSLAKAMLTKVAGLDSSNERVRQGVATEIIEWEMGRPTQSLEHTGKDGEALLPSESIVSALLAIRKDESG
jgi:hypothetical protein